MEQDLRYRQLPLPELLKNAMRQCDGNVLQVLMSYLKAIERQASADTEETMAIVLSSYQCISAELCDAFTKFDVFHMAERISS